MNIAFYIHTLNIGGAEKVVVDYLKHLKDNGHNVILLSNYKTDSFLTRSLEETNIPIIEINKGYNKSFFYKVFYRLFSRLINPKRVNTAIKKHGIQLIHFHGYFEGMEKVKLPYNSLFFTFHSDFKRNVSSLGEKRSAVLKKMSDGGMNFIVLNTENKNELAKYYNTKSVYCIPNGINISDIRQHVYSKKNLFTSLSIPEKEFVVGHIGRFHPVKNHEKVLSVFYEIQKKIQNSILILVGGDVDDRVNLIRKKAAELGIEQKVFFAGNRSDAVSMLSAFDLLLFPSKSECLPLTLLEAQVLGIPYVASSTITRDVRCSENGLYLDNDLDDYEWASRALNLQRQQPPESINSFEIGIIISKIMRLYEEKLNEIK